MLMFGKISVGVVSAERSPKSAMSTASTTKVYGRLSAIWTIHTPALLLMIALPALAVAVHEAEERRDEEQGRQGGHREAADDRAAERRILLGPFTQRQRHRHHADDH